MVNEKVLIIGAGACGLTAARELCRKGYQVTVLEGRGRAGGRIHTLQDHEFPKRLEAGAEFIHGSLPVTLSLLNEYKISFKEVDGFFWQTKTGDVDKEDNFIDEHNRELIRHLRELKNDLTVERFLEIYFRDEKYNSLKNSVRGFVQGYDAADTSRASIFAFREEWMRPDNDERQFRIPEGYGKLIEAIADECTANGCVMHFNSIVKEAEWKRNEVVLTTAQGEKHSASRLIITIPAGVLLQPELKGGVKFTPPVEDKIKAFGMLGYGGVVKVALLFKNAFWKSEKVKRLVGKDLNKIGFIFSNAPLPTWWTQFPDDSPFLTGWIGGPPAKNISAKTEEEILQTCITSLAGIFRLSKAEVQSELLSEKIFDWVNDPFSAGAYSYSVVDGDLLKKQIRMPVEETLYFAGEALHKGSNQGTVEAALSEGFRVVREIEN
jgi:monoamine oxidase